MWIILTTYPVLDFDVTADAPVPVAAAAAAAAASCCFNFEAPDAAAQPLFFLRGEKKCWSDPDYICELQNDAPVKWHPLVNLHGRVGNLNPFFLPVSYFGSAAPALSHSFRSAAIFSATSGVCPR